MFTAVLVIVLADLFVIGFCVVFLARAGQGLERRAADQRQALERVRGALESLVREAETRAREFEQLLGVREKHLRALLQRLVEEEERLRDASPMPAASSAAARLRPGGVSAEDAKRLANAGLRPVDVARTLGADPAEVRLVLDLERRFEGGAPPPGAAPDTGGGR
jgi:hypothetical protein